MAAPRKNLVVLDDSAIKQLMNDAKFVKILPCLSQPSQMLQTTAKGGRNCSKCKRERTAIANTALGQAKRCIAGARGGTLTALKEAFNAKQIRVYAPRRDGRTVVKMTLR